MKGSLRVLALAPYPRSAPSTGFRLSQLQPALGRLGVDLRVHPFLTSDEYPRVRRMGTSSVFTLAGATRRLLRVLDGVGAFDAVVVQRGMTMGLDRFLLPRLKRAGIPVLYDFDDAVFLPQEGGRPWLERIRDPERTTAALCRAAAVVLAGNAYLADFARDAVGPAEQGRVRILPTVVDTDRLVPVPEQARRRIPVLGWMGSDSTVPYLDALAPALAEVTRRVSCRVEVVAGERRPRLEGVPFDFRSWSPAGEAEALQSFDVGLYPLPDTPWSRGKCGFKALQYLSSGVPCIASPVGVLTDIVRPDETGLHANDTEQWVEGSVALLGDAERRLRLGAAGRALVEAGYSVRRAAPLFAAAVRDAVSHGGR